MRILYISQKPAFPIVDGGSFAINRFLHDLSASFIGEIDYLIFSTDKHPFDINSNLHNTIKNITFYPLNINTNLSFYSFLRSCFSTIPYNVKRYHDQSIILKIKERLSINEYDYIFLDGFYTTAFLPELKALSNAKIIYRSHNVEHQIWIDRARLSKNRLKRIVLNMLAKKVAKYEERLPDNIDYIAAICDSDYRYFKKNARCIVQVIPVSIPPTTPNDSIKLNQICFIGNFNWFPNVEGICWFIDNVFFVLKKEYPSLVFHIAGYDSDLELKQYENDAIIVHGAVADSSAFIKAHGIFISPIFSGSGIKIKVLEAMNTGAPVVLSQKSAEGINFSSTRSFFETKEEATEQIKSLLDSAHLMEENRNEMIAIIKAQFSQDAVIAKLKSILHD